MKRHQFIGASPDLVVSCNCHGKGLCEIIKCPYTHCNSKRSSSHLKYLVATDHGDRLKKNSDYYYQIQGQMGVCDYLYCDLFVYTKSSGYHLERVLFDQCVWDDMLQKLRSFWLNRIAPEIVTNKMQEGNNVLLEHVYFDDTCMDVCVEVDVCEDMDIS